MAIYKNREVSVVALNNASNTPDMMLTVAYKDGTNENVTLSQVRFTEDEKKSLQKRYPNRLDELETVDQKDLEAVRLGVTPPSDPSYKEAALVEVQSQKQQELLQKNKEEAKAEAEKQLDAEVKADPKVKK